MQAHNLMAAIENNEVPSYYPSDYKFTTADFVGDIEKCVKFDFGELGNIPDIKPDDVEEALTCAPYDELYCEFSCDDVNSMTIYVKSKVDNLVVFSCFYKALGKYFNVGLLVINNGKHTYILNKLFAINKDLEQKAGIIISTQFKAVVSAFLAMSCSNVELLDNLPPMKLNQKRIKRGKRPLYEFKTLHLVVGGGGKGQPGEGGTHSVRQRLHFRKGHYRKVKPGLRKWIMPYAAGDPSLGVVDKDYAVDFQNNPEGADF